MRRTFPPRTRRADRRGSALILVLLMTVTLAAVAMSAILLTGSGTMLTYWPNCPVTLPVMPAYTFTETFGTAIPSAPMMEPPEMSVR